MKYVKNVIKKIHDIGLHSNELLIRKSLDGTADSLNVSHIMS